MLCNGKPALESNPPSVCSSSWVNLKFPVLATQGTVIQAVFTQEETLGDKIQWSPLKIRGKKSKIDQPIKTFTANLKIQLQGDWLQEP